MDANPKMQELLAIVSDKTGVKAEKAERLAGIVLNLILTQGHGEKVAALFAAMPGAEALARANGGLAGKLAGGMMGGPLAAITRMQSEGISSDQQKNAISAVIDYCETKAGAKLLRAAAANVPGLSGFL